MLDTEYIDAVSVPAYDRNYKEFNRRYFDFRYKDVPKALNSKKSRLTLTLVLASFTFSFFAPSESSRIIFRIITGIFCCWHFYEQRYVLLYNRAEKFSHREKYYPRMFFAFNLLLKSRRLYIENMPVAYYIMKAKQLLYCRDVISAEYLADAALRDFANCPEAKYVKAVCLQMDGKPAKAKKIFEDVSKMKTNSRIRESSEKMLLKASAG